MTSKKSRILMSLGTSVLALSLITSSLVGGTFAKYTSTVAGSDSARVAKFDFTVSDSKDPTLKLNKEGTTVINLFDTVYDTGVFGDSSSHNVNTEKLVAPGVEGNFGLVVENKSEVAVKANLTITETTSSDGGSTYDTPNATIPIVYAYTDSKGVTTFWSNVLTASDGSILLHEPTDLTGIQAAAASPVTSLANSTAFADAKAGKTMVKISGDLEALAAIVNADTATKLAPSNGSKVEAINKLDLGKNFTWFWAYEVYVDDTSNGNGYIPTARDGVDTGLVWDDASNAPQTTIPEIKVKIDVNITQMDTFTPAP